jgi:hypothetical protein
MKNVAFLLSIILSLGKANAQFVHVIKADSVLITNDSCTAELNLENSTKHINGFLYNKGNGRTEFRKMIKLNDSTLLFGGDTVLIGGNSKNFANTDLTFTGNRLHNLAGKKLTMRSNYYFGTEFYQSSDSIWLLAYRDTLNKWEDYGTLVANRQESYTMHWDNDFYKATSSFRNSAYQVSLSSRPFTVPDSRANKITMDTAEIRINPGKDSSLRIYPIKTRSNGSSYQPLMVDSLGNVYKSSSWPNIPLTLQQVTGYGNTTTNTIKPYPEALPAGAGTDSIVVWSASDSLLKKVPPRQTFAQTSTVTVSATDVQTTLTSSGAGSLTIPAESWFVGKTYKVVLHGTYSTSSVNPASLTIKIKLGTTVVAQGSFTLAANKTDVAFECRNEFTCRATGASGTVFSMGMMRSADNIVTKLNNGTSPTSVTLSTSQALNITAQLTNNVSGNSVSAYLILMEAMN